MEDRSFWQVTNQHLIWDSGDLFTWRMFYDYAGQYVGQEQENMYWPGDGNEPLVLFFSAEIDAQGRPCVNGKPVEPLTAEKIEQIRFEHDKMDSLKDIALTY